MVSHDPPPPDAPATLPADPAPPAPPPRWLQAVRGLENAAVIATFAVMALLTVLEVVGRKLVGGGIPGSASMVHHLTMWAGFLGALLATREGHHLALSTAELLPEGRVRDGARFFTWTLAACVSAMLSYASFKVVQSLLDSPNMVGPGIPEWASVAVMPVTLGIMALRQVVLSTPRWGLRALGAVAVVGCFLLGLLSPEAAAHVAWPGAFLILVALLLGAPIYVGMSGLAMVMFFAADTPVASVPYEAYKLVSSPTLPAVPILTAAGYVLAVGGSSRRLVRLMRATVGALPAGMAVTAIAVCAVFTTLTGGSGVTILALGGLVYPILREEQYPENFSLGLVTASGSLGLLFFPSVPVILYAVVAQQPMERLFVAGLLPGAVMILAVCVYAVVVGTRHGAPRHPLAFSEFRTAVWEAKWDLGVPVILLATFASGLATMVEASSLALVYAVLVEVVLCKTLSGRVGLPKALSDAGTLVGAVLIVLGMAMGLTNYLVDEGIPQTIIEWVTTHISSRVLFLLTLNALLLVLGSVLEIFSAIVILAPLLAPMGAAYGIDPVHLGIIFLANLELGFLFPPVGLNLFLSSSRFGKPLPQLYRAAFPFLVIMAVSVLAITYIPALSTGVLAAWEGRAGG